MPPIAVNSFLRELTVVRNTDVYKKNSDYAPVKFQSAPPLGVLPGAGQPYAESRYRQFLRPFVHPTATGYGALKTLSGLKLATITNQYQGSWEEGIVEILAAKAYAGTIKLYVHKYPILSWSHFKEASKASGMRNRVVAIDGILKRPSFATYGSDIYGQKAFPNNQDLKDLIAACDIYLADPKRQASLRIPAITAVKLAAQIELALNLDLKTGDYKTARAFLIGSNLLECRNREGFTPVGLINTVMGGDKRTELAKMDTDGCDLSAPQAWGFRPIDIAKSMNNTKHEQWFSGQGAVSSSPLVVKTNTVDALVEATIGYELTRNMREAFTSLYANPLFRPILDLAAKDARKGRQFATFPALNKSIDGARKQLRFFFVEAPTVSGFRTGAGAGNYELANNTLGVCGKGPQNVTSIEKHIDGESRQDRDMYQRSLEGTLIHELTHFAAFKVYANSCLPYRPLVGPLDATQVATDANEQQALDYYAAYVADWKANKDNPIIKKWAKNRDHVDEAESTIGGRQDDPNFVEGYRYMCLFGHVFSYALKFSNIMGGHYKHNDADLMNGEGLGDTFYTGVGMEAITHLPQAIHCFGGAIAIGTIMPNLLAWFQNVFLPDVTLKAA